MTASIVGVSLGEVARAIVSMQQNIANGSSVFQRLGLGLDQLRSMSPEEQFSSTATRLAMIADPQQRSAVAMEVFGVSGATITFLARGGLFSEDMARLLSSLHEQMLLERRSGSITVELHYKDGHQKIVKLRGPELIFSLST